MRCVVFTAFAAAALAMVSSAAHGQWVDFVNETNWRMVSDPAVGTADSQEKDYDWGDVNNNGWVDLVVVRKQPFTSSGRRRNVLFMNENGVLVDRSAEYASASDVSGDQGFLTPTNDRDVRVVDLIDNGWRDIVTATTLSDGQAKHISHPRIYMNLGQGKNAKGGGAWLGFRHEDARIPVLACCNGSVPHAPRFCAVAAGDVTNNGYPDLYFADYDSGGSQTLDFNDRLLINDGNGYFTDESTQRMQQAWLSSNFGAQAVIDDMNGTGVNDVVKVNALGAYHTAIIYNNPASPGFFISHQIAESGSTYFASVADLNKNGRLDIVITHDGQDRVKINQGNNAQNQATFVNTMLPESTCGSGNICTGFGSNSVAADLNNNGWLDILIADVDVDIGGFSGHSNIYRNTTTTPGGSVSFSRDLGTIGVSMLQGVFDFAVFDLTGNGWLDIVVGRSAGTQIWINQPTFFVEFAYPGGRPFVLTPGEDTEITVELEASGGDLSDPRLHVSVAGGPFIDQPLIPVAGAGGDGDLYIGTLPAVECNESVRYYVTAEISNLTFHDPADAPNSSFTAIAAEGMEVVFSEAFEGDVSGWTVASDPSLTGGEWEQAVPVATFVGGNLASPDGDNSPDPNGKAFITENCSFPGQPPGQCNVKHGPTWLTSPVIDLGAADARISYDRWFFCSTPDNPIRADFLFTEVSNDDGETWVPVHHTGGTGGDWETTSFIVSGYVAPTAQVRVRFWTDDENNNSITNAAIDNFRVEEFLCATDLCPGDLNNDSAVDVLDLLIMLDAWGSCPRGKDCPGDLNGDGAVDVLDLLILLDAWGACPK